MTKCAKEGRIRDMKRFFRILKVLLVLAALAFIWGHSMVPAALSSVESERFLALVRPLVTAAGRFLERLGIRAEESVLVRKLAHFAEYAVLGVLTYLLFVTPRHRGRLVLPAMFCLGAAAVDESIQRHIEGRAPALRDVGIDFAGACLGILAAAIVVALLFGLGCLVRKKRK